MDKLDRKQRDDRQDTVLLPYDQGIASFLNPDELGKLNQTSKIMKKETDTIKGTYRHSSDKDVKKVLDRLARGIKKKSRRRKRRKPKKRKTRRRKRKTRRRKRKTRKK